MAREIVKFGSRVLRQRCAPVEPVDDAARALVRDLFDSMRAAEGVGLAAPQIGVPSRVVVVDISHQEPLHPPVALINPRIVSLEGSQVGEEGCLSFPDLYSEVKRAELVVIEALDENGESIRISADGFLARALQHEIDHLEGKLFVDHISSLKRQLMRGSLKRLKREGEAWDQEHGTAVA
jgi:peptide deformylase